jgi:hypothetical protein
MAGRRQVLSTNAWVHAGIQFALRSAAEATDPEKRGHQRIQAPGAKYRGYFPGVCGMRGATRMAATRRGSHIHISIYNARTRTCFCCGELAQMHVGLSLYLIKKAPRPSSSPVAGYVERAAKKSRWVAIGIGTRSGRSGRLCLGARGLFDI